MYSKKKFPNQKPGEETVFFLRRHWVVVLKIVFLTIIIACIPLIFYLGYAQEAAFMDTMSGYALFMLLISAYYLFVILFTFTNFIDYYLDVWIVTTERVINIEQKGLFGREMSEKELVRMQDISSNIKGFWATVFKYGDITIQTAGEEQKFVFKQVPHAEEVTRKISNLVALHQNNVVSEKENLDANEV